MDVESGKSVGVSPTINCGVSSVAFSVDGAGIVSVSGGVVRIWDACLRIESEERSFGSSGLLIGVEISKNGLQVVPLSGNGTVQLWDALTGEQVGADFVRHTSYGTCFAFRRILLTCDPSA